MTASPSLRHRQGHRTPLVEFAKTPVRVFADLGVPELANCNFSGPNLDRHLRQLVRSDAKADRDEFQRGIRLSLVIEYGLSQERPKALKMPAKKWIEEHAGVRYETAQKFRRFLQLQVRLSSEELPLIRSVNQGRVLLPFATLGADELIDAVRALGAKELPPPKQLKQELARRLATPVPRQGNAEKRAVAHANALLRLLQTLPKAGRERRMADCLVRRLIARTGRPARKRQTTPDVPGQMTLPGT